MTIENGSGLAGADSYTAVSVADSYHLLRGNTSWGNAGVDAKSAALIRACDYLERMYGSLWPGARISKIQRLSFPRYGMEALWSGAIPPWLIEAQCEAAVLELMDPGILAASESEGGFLKEEREGEVTRRYAAGAETVRRFPSVYRILSAHIRCPAQVLLERV